MGSRRPETVTSHDDDDDDEDEPDATTLNFNVLFSIKDLPVELSSPKTQQWGGDEGVVGIVYG
jgi:hypothetical protein